MYLIKISGERVQVKSDLFSFGELHINDLLKIYDAGSELICVVSEIQRSESPEVYDVETGEIMESDPKLYVECAIIGSLSDGKFSKSIETYPGTSVEIEKLSEAEFMSMLDVEGFKIGKYTSYNCDAYIDGNKFFQRHFAILGNTGSGKSYTVASILEKVKDLKGSNVIVFDVHGEYKDLDYVSEIKIGNGEMPFPIWFVPLKDIISNILKLKEETSTVQSAIFRKAFYHARHSTGKETNDDAPIYFNIGDLLKYLVIENNMVVGTGEYYKSGSRAGEEKTTKGENFGKLNSIITLLDDKKNDPTYGFMFKDMGQAYLEEFAEKVLGTEESNIKVINLSDVPSDVMPMIIAITLKLIYRLHIEQDREDMIPLNVVCDEAHIYIPSSGFGIGASERRLLDIFETIAKEGRKFGVSLAVASQRPSELNKTIMAQCANFIIMKMSNDTDKQMMKSMMPEGTRSVLDAVNLFAPGDCMIVGDCAPITLKLKVDMPIEGKPNSNTINTWDVWGMDRKLSARELVEKMF